MPYLTSHRRRDIGDEELDRCHNHQYYQHKEVEKEQPGEPNVPELDIGRVGLYIELTTRPGHEVGVTASCIQIAGMDVCLGKGINVTHVHVGEGEVYIACKGLVLAEVVHRGDKNS